MFDQVPRDCRDRSESQPRRMALAISTAVPSQHTLCISGPDPGNSDVRVWLDADWRQRQGFHGLFRTKLLLKGSRRPRHRLATPQHAQPDPIHHLHRRWSSTHRNDGQVSLRWKVARSDNDGNGPGVYTLDSSSIADVFGWEAAYLRTSTH